MKTVAVISLSLCLTSCGFFASKNKGSEKESESLSSKSLSETSNSESLFLTNSTSSFELTAKKDYRPSRWTDGKHEFPSDTEFKVPATLQVVFGNSGNHKSFLYFKKAADSKESRCEYKGGSSQSQPKGSELAKANVYKLLKCDGGLKPGDFGLAKNLRLNLDNGGNYNNTKDNTHTIIKVSIEYKSSSGPVLPPDPGEAGKATLLGIDSDNDGVRDDIQRWIVQNYGQYPELVRRLKRFSRSSDLVFSDMDDKNKAIIAIHKSIKDRHCIGEEAKKLGLDSYEITKEYLKIRNNTKERLIQRLKSNQYFSGQTIEGSSPEFLKTYCLGE